MKLIKIDPDNPPQFNIQMLFYDSTLNLFRLGEVDYIREDGVGKYIVYKSFDSVRMLNTTNNMEVLLDFIPTHYSDLDLEELVNTLQHEQ